MYIVEPKYMYIVISKVVMQVIPVCMAAVKHQCCFPYMGDSIAITCDCDMTCVIGGASLMCYVS